MQEDVDIVEDDDSELLSSTLCRDDCNCKISMWSGHDKEDVEEDDGGWL